LKIGWLRRGQGIKLLSPLAKLVDEVSAEVVWDKETHSTEQLKVIMKNSKPSERPNAATSWSCQRSDPENLSLGGRKRLRQARD